jgi:hypothetical protein
MMLWEVSLTEAMTHIYPIVLCTCRHLRVRPENICQKLRETTVPSAILIVDRCLAETSIYRGCQHHL